MGRPMAKNLLKAGYPLIVHSRKRGARAGTGRRGAQGGRLSEGRRWGRWRFSSPCWRTLPRSSWWRSAVTASSKGPRKACSISTCRLISPLVSQKVGKALGVKAVRMLDAPVVGRGKKGAIDAALSIMVGGEKADLRRRAPPSSRCWARPSRIWGPLWRGWLHLQLRQQIIVAINLTALGEALTLAKKAGLRSGRSPSRRSAAVWPARSASTREPELCRGHV